MNLLILRFLRTPCPPIHFKQTRPCPVPAFPAAVLVSTWPSRCASSCRFRAVCTCSCSGSQWENNSPHYIWLWRTHFFRTAWFTSSDSATSLNFAACVGVFCWTLPAGSVVLLIPVSAVLGELPLLAPVLAPTDIPVVPGKHSSSGVSKQCF